MTSDTRDLSTTEQRSHPPDRVQLSAVQVAASALASVSAAVVASLFGVTGTVVGAGLVAVLSTTGSAIYSSSMKRTTDQLRRAREQLLTVRTGENRTPGRRSTRTGNRTIDLTDGADTAAQAAAVDPQTAAEKQSRWRRGWLTVGSRRGLKWPALLGAAVLVFAIAIGLITAFEAITQKPISSLTGNSSSSSTTIGSLTGNSKATPTPTPSVTPSGNGSSDTSSPSAVPSATSTGQGSSTQSPAPASATPRASASAAPTSAAPKPSTGSGSSSTGGTGGTSGQDIQVPVP